MKVYAPIMLAAAATLISAPALAQQGLQMTPEQRAVRFVELDVNKDEKLDKAEWAVSLPEQMKSYADQIWSMMDSDGDGSVTKEQYTNFRPQRPA